MSSMSNVMKTARARAARAMKGQRRGYGNNFDNYRQHTAGPKQFGQGAPYYHGAWQHGTCRSILERSGWAMFFFIPIEAAYLFYEFGYRRVDAEMGPWITDVTRYDGTEYDEQEEQVRYRWATDGTLCQYKREHAERRARDMLHQHAKFRIDMRREREG